MNHGRISPNYSILLYSEHVNIEFTGPQESAFRGKKEGRIYLTTHRMIFNNKNPRDEMQSFSFPFVTLSDVSGILFLFVCFKCCVRVWEGDKQCAFVVYQTKRGDNIVVLFVWLVGIFCFLMLVNVVLFVWFVGIFYILMLVNVFQMSMIT